MHAARPEAGRAARPAGASRRARQRRPRSGWDRAIGPHPVGADELEKLCRPAPGAARGRRLRHVEDLSCCRRKRCTSGPGACPPARGTRGAHPSRAARRRPAWRCRPEAPARRRSCGRKARRPARRPARPRAARIAFRPYVIGDPPFESSTMASSHAAWSSSQTPTEHGRLSASRFKRSATGPVAGAQAPNVSGRAVERLPERPRLDLRASRCRRSARESRPKAVRVDQHRVHPVTCSSPRAPRRMA